MSDSAAMPAVRAAASRSHEEVADLAHHVVVVRVLLHRARLTLHVHRDVARAGVRDDAEQVGIVAPGGDVVDDRRAGFERAGRDRWPSSCRRSPAPTSSAARARMTGTTRAASSSAETGAAPGRVDSPPTSSTAAPSSRSAIPCAIAASGIEVEPTVGEGIRGHVDDAHDPARDLAPVEHQVGQRTAARPKNPSARGDFRDGR